MSDTSLTDMVLFHENLRDIEASIEGILYDVIHTYKEIDLGGGAIFPALAFINGWTLQFPSGNFTISGGNLNVSINPIPNCYVMQTQAGSYAVTSVGDSSGGTFTEDDRTKLFANATKKDVINTKFM